MFVPGIGTFELAPDVTEVRLTPEGSPSPDQVDDALHRIAVPLGLQLAGQQVLHASAVIIGGVVALCGPAGAGKSTIAYGLSQRGCPLWADDAVAFERSADGLQARPLRFRIRLRPMSADWFGAPAHRKGAELAEPWTVGSDGTRRFRALFVLERLAARTDDRIELVRLAPTDAFTHVLPHAYFLTLDDGELKSRLLDAYLTLAEQLPVFVLRYVPRLSLVERIAERVQLAVEQL